MNYLRNFRSQFKDKYFTISLVIHEKIVNKLTDPP